MSRPSTPDVAGIVSTCRLDAAAIRKIAAERLSQVPEVRGPGASDFDLNPEVGALGPVAFRPAAVLVPIIARFEPAVILTVRTLTLPAHAGQIAFPGGRIEPSDSDPLAAALRESREEIGLDPELVEPLGYLEPYRTGTGYVITPVVGLVDPGFEPAPDASEVEAVFEVPLAHLMNSANHMIDSREWRGVRRRFYAMIYGERYIWGATAGILKALHRRLFEA